MVHQPWEPGAALRELTSGIRRFIACEINALLYRCKIRVGREGKTGRKSTRRVLLDFLLVAAGLVFAVLSYAVAMFGAVFVFAFEGWPAFLLAVVLGTFSVGLLSLGVGSIRATFRSDGGSCVSEHRQRSETDEEVRNDLE